MVVEFKFEFRFEHSLLIVPLTPTHFRSRVIENGADLSAPILVMSARDRDDPPHNRIEYSLRDDLGGTFRINATTGEIFAERQLDRETGAEYMLEVRNSSSVQKTSIPAHHSIVVQCTYVQ